MRKEEIFTNCEFFEEFFLPFLQKNIEKEKNVRSILIMGVSGIMFPVSLLRHPVSVHRMN